MPIKLKKEPLVEAVCELRLVSSQPLHQVLPGMLMSAFAGEVANIQSTPIVGIPEQVRLSDPNLAHAPLVTLIWAGYKVAVGTGVATISAVYPYPGWSVFCKKIAELFGFVLTSGLVARLDRYSVKYLNIFQHGEAPAPENALNIHLEMGGLSLSRNTAVLRVECVEAPFTTIIQMIGSATVHPEGRPIVSGLVLDVDTICPAGEIAVAKFANELPARLDELRLVNKRVFFQCLKQEAIDAMGPQYAD